ncbi:MAG: extracellular solute-binding protein [Thermodesulfobacteriota bacterium]|nr:extracellular solute-binding protein [Thermodesulfobacteriota bacterium]
MHFKVLSIVVMMLLIMNGCQKVDQKTSIHFWTSEVEQDRIQVQEKLAERFEASNPNVDVRIVPVDENVLPEKVAAAKAAGSLPNVMEVGLVRISTYAAAGVFNTGAATEVINELGKDTFYKGPLELCRNPRGEGYAAIPIDGWIQGIWYRKDLFREKGLSKPITWQNILNAAKAFNHPEKARYGIVIGTDPQKLYTQQVFEQFALSNGIRIFREDGRIEMDCPRIASTLEYYTELAGYGPPGHNHWREARQYYITGKAAMMFYSPYIIDDIAGLVEKYEPTVPQLAKKTGFVPVIEGPQGEKAGYGEIYALGICNSERTEESKAWVRFLLNEGYGAWISMSPGGKTPVRKTVLEEWKGHHYFSYYEPGLAETIASGMENIQRWGYSAGMTFPKIGDIHGLKLVPMTVGRILAKKMTATDACLKLQKEMEAVTSK